MITRRLFGTLLLSVACVQAAAAQDWEKPRHARRDGLHIRVGRSYHLPPDQIAAWPVVVIGGRAVIEGRVEDDIVVIGGPVEIGPTAVVRANVVAIGGHVRVAESAEITGELHDIGILWPDIRLAIHQWPWGIDRGWWAVFSLLGTVFRFTLTLMAACLLALVAPGWLRRIQSRAADAPLASGLFGLAGEILVVPFFLVLTAGLVLTIVGIPLLILLPFAALAFLVTWLAGYAAMAAHLGSRTGAGSRFAMGPSVLEVAWGVTLIFAVTFAGNVLALAPWFVGPVATAFSLAGFVIEFLAWTIGLGAALLAPLRRRWETGPPPVPSTHPSPSSFGTANA